MYPHRLLLEEGVEQRVAHALVGSFDSSMVSETQVQFPTVWPGAGYLIHFSLLAGPL